MYQFVIFTLYFLPISRYADEAFAEFHKVDGLRGIYIASIFNETGGDITEDNMVSAITYDKGGEWQKLQAPERDINNHDLNCELVSLSWVGRRVGATKGPMCSWTKTEGQN